MRILILEDRLEDAELIARALRGIEYSFDWQRVDTEAGYLAALEDPPDIILADYSLPGFSALAALELLQMRRLDVPFIVVTGALGDEAVVECLKLGAADYLIKDRLARLPEAVAQALEKKRLCAEQQRILLKLRDSEERFRQVAEHIREVFFLINAEHTETLYVNSAYEAIWGRSRDGLYAQPKSWIEAVHPEDFRRVLRIAARAKATGQFDMEYRIVRPDGVLRWVRARGFPIYDERGALYRIAGIAEDITEQKLYEERATRLSRIHGMLGGINSAIVRIRNRQELFNEACRVAVDHGGFGIAWIGAYDSETLKVTPVAWAGVEAEALAMSAGTARSDLPLGQGIVGRAIREHRPVFDNDIAANPHVGGKRRREAIRRGYRSSITLPLVVEGQIIGNFSLFAKEPSFFDDEEVRLLAELAGDISYALEYIGKEEKISYLAYFDALTGLPNRSLAAERLTQALHAADQNKTRIAVVIVDIRRFHHINDTFGRHVGDDLLRQLAMRFRRLWPDPDNVSRIAADCFSCLQGDLRETTEIAHLLEQVIMGTLDQPFFIDGNEFGISLIAGVALSPDDGNDAETLFRNAEAALNEAKQKGQRYLFYEPAMNASIAQTLLMESKLRRAVDAGQFVLHYQPKVDLRSEQVCGVEALIRWNDPGYDLVPPEQFIPILEETGLILPVGAWAMSRAQEDYSKWLGEGLSPPRIAVNVSPMQLQQKDFVQSVKRVLSAYDEKTWGLDLEITESLIMKDIDENIAKLTAIRDMGINIAIDDFGTGYSSLGYLARLPVNALKIDHSFISTMLTNPNSMTIVSTIISLAHSLNMKVIAEGVEVEDQQQFLRLLKCNEMQGYISSKPLPAEFFKAKFLQGGHPA